MYVLPLQSSLSEFQTRSNKIQTKMQIFKQTEKFASTVFSYISFHALRLLAVVLKLHEVLYGAVLHPATNNSQKPFFFSLSGVVFLSPGL